MHPHSNSPLEPFSGVWGTWLCVSLAPSISRTSGLRQLNSVFPEAPVSIRYELNNSRQK